MSQVHRRPPSKIPRMVPTGATLVARHLDIVCLSPSCDSLCVGGIAPLFLVRTRLLNFPGTRRADGYIVWFSLAMLASCPAVSHVHPVGRVARKGVPVAGP